VVACNTASAHALGHLQRELSIPVIGVVDPGAAAAAGLSAQGKVGVIGTLGTVNSGAYQRAMQRLRPELTVFGQACPLLVPLAEEGWVDHPVTAQVVRHYLVELQSSAGDLDTLVLGCTHYPLLRRSIAEQAEIVFGHPVTLVDSADATAAAVSRELRARDLASVGERSGAHRFFFTDVNRFGEMASRFFGAPLGAAEHADL